VAEVFRRGGQFAKHPGGSYTGVRSRINLIRFLSVRYRTRRSVPALLDDRFGSYLRAIILADGAVAIDVDNEAQTLRVCGGTADGAVGCSTRNPAV
jgi:hypothetical protein